MADIVSVAGAGPIPPAYYPYTNKLRVDPNGIAGYTKVKDAMADAALLPRSFFDYVVVEVNWGVWFEEPFTVPSFVILKTVGHTGEIQLPCTVITPATVVDSDTDFVTFEENSIAIGCAFAVFGALPADFLGDYSFIKAEGNVKLDRCSVQVGVSYSGANRFYLIDNVGPSAPLRLNRSSISMPGDSTILVRSSVPTNIVDTNFGGEQLKKLELNHTSGTSEVISTNLYQATPGVVAGGFVVDLPDAGATIELNGTRLRRSDFDGAGTIVEVHATPAQLFTALKADVRIVATADGAPDKIINAQNDATLFADTTAGIFTVTMPPITGAVLPAVNAVEGETFVIGNIGSGGNDLTVAGDGGDTIDGGASITLADGVTCLIQLSDAADGTNWRVISTTGGAIATTLATKSGTEPAVSFVGAPRKATITFGAAFADALYSVAVIGSDARAWSVDTIVAGSFVINANSAAALLSPVLWIAIKHGET